MVFPVVSYQKLFVEESVVTLVTPVLLSSRVLLLHVHLHLTFTGHHYLTNDTLCTEHYLLDTHLLTAAPTLQLAVLCDQVSGGSLEELLASPGG